MISFAVFISLFLIFSELSILMNITFSLEQLSRTGNLDANSISRQYKLDSMARFMEIKTMNPKLF